MSAIKPAEQRLDVCPVGRNIQGVLTRVYEEAERRMEAQLAETTIASILGSVQ